MADLRYVSGRHLDFPTLSYDNQDKLSAGACALHAIGPRRRPACHGEKSGSKLGPLQYSVFIVVIGAGDGNRTHDIQLGKHSKSKLKQEVKVKTSLQDHIFLVQIKNRLKDDMTLWSEVGKVWAETAQFHGFSVRAAPVATNLDELDLVQRIRKLCARDPSFPDAMHKMLADWEERKFFTLETVVLFERMEADELFWVDVGKILLETVNINFAKLGFKSADKGELGDLKNDLLDPDHWGVVYLAWLDSGHLLPFQIRRNEEPSS